MDHLEDRRADLQVLRERPVDRTPLSPPGAPAAT
jgi:hypothetical protein